MVEIKNFEPRTYQLQILETCKQKNTLVCMPTGLGKTKSAILLAVDRLTRKPESKIIICSPTKPLANQIYEEFKECTTIPASKIKLVTGMVHADQREKNWEESTVIVATPQTIENDAVHNRIHLEQVSLLCLDECHRSKERFANTKVAGIYKEKNPTGRILALTASPGATKEKIEEVCKNLFIEAIEIKTDDDEEVKKYIQNKELSYEYVVLSPELNEVKEVLKGIYLGKIEQIAKFGIYKPRSMINKADLLKLQARLFNDIKRGNPAAYSGVSLTAQALKLAYLLELIETQSISSAKKYIEKLKQEETKAAKTLCSNENFIKIITKITELQENGIQHPKIIRLKEIIQQELAEKEKVKIIIFSNYRAMVAEIVNELKKVDRAKPTELVGQKEGLTQKEQIQKIKEFEEDKYNLLVCTSIGEEGLSLGTLDLAIFYDHTASEIRKIQRSGRVGRVKPGRIIYIVARKTRDEALIWTAHYKEKKMKNILTMMKSRLDKENKQVNLGAF